MCTTVDEQSRDLEFASRIVRVAVFDLDAPLSLHYGNWSAALWPPPSDVSPMDEDPEIGICIKCGFAFDNAAIAYRLRTRPSVE